MTESGHGPDDSGYPSDLDFCSERLIRDGPLRAITAMERRLAAILAADVAGYSRLMGISEEGTHQSLKSHRRDLVEPKIEQHHGRIIKNTGDGFLAEFMSVVEAVRCAAEIQQEMAARNSELPDDRRIDFRMGVHQGDVIVDSGDIFGDGVNIAARLEGIADPGGVCVSARVQEDVRGTLDLPFDDIGEQHLKNIQRPVRVYRIALGSKPATTTTVFSLPDRPSIAVLPFQNLSGDEQQEYFADGMVEDIINGLSRIKGLFVIARSSTLSYKGRAVDIKQVGHDLGVRYALGGTVRKVADRLRITADLVEAATGMHVWTERYERKLDDIFVLQDELTLSVVATIQPSLRSAEIERVKRKRPDSLDAYDLVLQAQHDVYAQMKENVTRALVLLQRALALDPHYALAHGYTAMCYHTLYLRGGLSEDDRQASVRHAQAALLHGQDDALALTCAAFCIGMDGHDRASALPVFEAALAISPSSALTYLLGSVMFAWGGNAIRGIEWGDRGVRLSPFDPWRASGHIAVALGHFQQSNFEESANAARKAVQSRPGFSICYMVLAAPLAKLGRIKEAKNAAMRALELQPALRFSLQFAGVDCDPALSAALREPLLAAGLPE
jgi:adenylate cyclase